MKKPMEYLEQMQIDALEEGRQVGVRLALDEVISMEINAKNKAVIRTLKKLQATLHFFLG